jgi:long-chain acyl-CoA synthetase
MNPPQTLIHIFLDSVERRPRPDQFLRHGPRSWEPLSSARARADVEALAHGLRGLGVGRGDRVALLSENRYEWPILDLAALALGAVTVPIYPSSTADQVRHVLADSGARLAVVSTASQLAKVRAVAGRLPALAGTLHVDPVPDPASGDCDLARLLAAGESARRADPDAFAGWVAAVRPDHVATIIYTSGTTGEPKGAVLTHGNIASNVWAGLSVLPISTHDRCLSFLPLCHIFERMAGLYAMLAAGVSIAYAQSLDSVAHDAMSVRPTLMMGVPRFFEKVYARVMDNARAFPAPRRAMFHWGIEQGRGRARAHFARRRLPPHRAALAALADLLVARRVRDRMGGRLRFCISGGAPLAPKVIEFFFAIGIPIREGYGLTETSPVICLNPPGREKPGSVGRPLPGVEVAIADNGEILTRGPHVMRGYFNDPQATSRALADGWFHTGDIGHLDDEGYLHVTDRLKDLLVTAGGKKVAPQPIEADLKSSKWISEAVLLGDQRPYVVCLLVPNLVNLQALARTRGWSFTRPADLLLRDDVRRLYQAEVDRANAGLASFQQIKHFALLDRDLSQEGGELTPTLKVRRRVIAETFAPLIGGLYDRATTPPGR